MNQKGLTAVYIVIGILLAVLAGSFLYVKQNSSRQLSINSQEQKQATNSATIINSPSPVTKTNLSASPAKSSTSKPTIKPVNSPASSPSPTPVVTVTPTPVAKKNTCGVEVVYGKMGGGFSDPLLVTLVASFTSHNNAYLTGAQWDFEGDGKWDTDLKQLNGQMEHTYSQAGTYTAKLQVQGSDGANTDICSKSFTVPSGTPVKLTGKVYGDLNCNGIPEPNEKGVGGATVTIWKMPEFSIYTTLSTDSSGYYNFSQNVQANDSLSVSPSLSPVPGGYKANPSFKEPTFALSNGQSSVNVDLPVVPNENVGACQY